MYTLKTWNHLGGYPTVRTGLLYAVAWGIATKADYAKAQVICETTDTIQLETKEATPWPLH